MTKYEIKIGGQTVHTDYDELEALYCKLENIFGINAVELNEDDEKEVIAEIIPMLYGMDETCKN